MTDNNQDRSQDQGQKGIDRDTEQRNRENETGQPGSEQFGQKGDQPAESDTTLSERTGQTGGRESTDEGASGESGFVGSQGDQSSDYLTKGEESQDFTAEGQGAQDSDAGRSDIETGQAQDKESNPDDGSGSDR